MPNYQLIAHLYALHATQTALFTSWLKLWGF